MAKPLLDDGLWALIQPLLPPPKPRRFRFPGRKPVEDRAALTGIVFVLRSGIPWEMLPQEMGCGSGMTCWRRLHAWQEAGVWDKVHHVLLERLHRAGQIDWSRAAVDSASIRAVGAGEKKRPQSHRSRQSREQASSHHRRDRRAAERSIDGRQRARCDATAPLG